MKKHSNKLTFLRRVILVAAAVILGLSAYFWNARNLLGNRMPMPFGYGISVVLSGSMEPEISAGDLVVVQKTDDIQIGDVLVYQSGDSLVIHRLVTVENGQLILQGDANNIADDPISGGAVKGKMVLLLPGAGAWVQLLRKPAVIVAILALAVLLMECSYRREKQQGQKELEDIRQEIRSLIQEINTSE